MEEGLTVQELVGTDESILGAVQYGQTESGDPAEIISDVVFDYMINFCPDDRTGLHQNP
jgi:hypothetical protein